jgi:hypothetical protein
LVHIACEDKRERFPVFRTRAAFLARLFGKSLALPWSPKPGEISNLDAFDLNLFGTIAFFNNRSKEGSVEN